MDLERLTIVVPYRDRLAHLREFIPHMAAYFSRDVAASVLNVRILVVEQVAGGPFNRGLMKNIGFLESKAHSSQICFHDIDYLPVWADYSPIDRPACIVWYGAEVRTISAKSSKLIRANLEKTFGCAVLMPTADFAAVNGYANAYWGWGYEDCDLMNRFSLARIALGRRKGTFRPLDHDSDGYKVNGAPSGESLANKVIYDARWANDAAAQAAMDADGLAQTRYEIIKRVPLPPPPTLERDIPIEMLTVRVPLPS